MVKYTLKEKVIKFLIENQSSSHSIMEISKKLKADYKNTSLALQSINSNLYTKEKQGSSNLININHSNNQEILSVEEKRLSEFLSINPKLGLIKQDITKLNYPFIIALIFGSYSKSKSTKNSDIDLCLICDSPKKIKELETQLSLLPLNLELHIFTTAEFESMLNKKENNLSKEITKNNIILFGKESYYNFVSKWIKKE